MDPQLGSAFIGIIGGLIGGAMSAVVGWRQSHKQFVRDSRQRDYNVFVEAIAGMSQATPNSQERRIFVAKAIGAKGKIILNSSPTVLNALAKYSGHAALATEESYTDFANLLTAMRSDIGGEPAPMMAKRIRAILFEGTTK
jgi:hypothetical protein